MFAGRLSKMNKTCTQCKISKSITEFYRKPTIKSACKKCFNSKAMEYQKSSPVRASYWKNYRKTESYRKYQRDYKKKIGHRLTEDNKLANGLRNRLRKALKSSQKTGSAVRDLGCSIPELKAYLEVRFQPGMNWGNYGKWHIDHIKPLSSFDLTNREELLKACHYTNLQPLWAKDNLEKSAKIIG